MQKRLYSNLWRTGRKRAPLGFGIHKEMNRSKIPKMSQAQAGDLQAAAYSRDGRQKGDARKAWDEAIQSSASAETIEQMIDRG
jgi:hypothetical protein